MKLDEPLSFEMDHAIDLTGENDDEEEECMVVETSDECVGEKAMYLKTSKQLSDSEFMLLENATCAKDKLFTVAIRAAILVSNNNV